MLIAILTLGGAILGATSLAGLLMLYQIRSTTDSENSAKAIFAADAGINWALYSYFQPPAGPLPNLGGGVSTTVTCYESDQVTQSACDNPATTWAYSEGTSNGARRELIIEVAAATSVFP